MQMYDAIISGDLESVKRLQIENPPCIDETHDGISLANVAASTGNLDILQYIVEYSRASFNETDEHNRTILHYAVPSGNLEMVKYIVERMGFSPLDGDDELITPYDLAMEQNITDIIEYFKSTFGDINSMYRNPIRTGMHPDPSIVCVGDDFYMVNSSFIYFPCIPISHSKDLIHWEVIGHAITNPEWAYLNELEGGRGYWAPDISYHKGRFYITATYRLNDTGTVYRKQMVVSSDKPEGPYCEPAFISEDGIDPSIFTDDDGKRYMLLNRGARLFEISEDGTKQLGEAKLLYYGTNKRAPEGSHLLKKDGWYYLFQAEGGTGLGHMITVSRSDSLFGVYKPCPFNPILRQNNPKGAIQRCGHGKPVQTPNGEWFIPYLCGRQLEHKYSLLGRETALDKITWTADGWPMVNNLDGPSVLALKPDLPEFTPHTESDSFGTKLSSIWSWVRVPEKEAFYLKNDALFLKAGHNSLSTMYSRNILVRPQEDFVFECECTLNMNVPKYSQAGMTCYYDENTYLTFHIENNNGKLYLCVFEHVYGILDTNSFIIFLGLTENSEDILNNDITLKIHTDKLSRSFYYRTIHNDKGTDNNNTDNNNHIIHKPKDFTFIGTLDNVYYLCDEGLKKGKRFTGAMTGIYAYSDKSEFYAEFKNFVYKKS